MYRLANCSKPVNRRNRFAGCLLPVALTLLLAAPPTFANPTGELVVSGIVDFANVGNTLTITNSPGSIIHWNEFSIGAGEITNFVQQTSASAVLNRVVGLNPSQLLGTLSSNGKVFLINPNGILFGAGAQVDVGGLVASTLDINNTDFLAGNMLFNAGPTAGVIDNQGTISAPTGGEIYLIAPDITNSGLITAPNGTISLAAGHSVELVDSTRPDLSVVVSAVGEDVNNLGSLIAAGGSVDIYGALVRQAGVVSADSVVAGETGRIYFRSSGATIIADGSSTFLRDGTIQIDSTDTITLAADLNAGLGDINLNVTNGGLLSVYHEEYDLDGMDIGYWPVLYAGHLNLDFTDGTFTQQYGWPQSSGSLLTAVDSINVTNRGTSYLGIQNDKGNLTVTGITADAVVTPVTDLRQIPVAVGLDNLFGDMILSGPLLAPGKGIGLTADRGAITDAYNLGTDIIAGSVSIFADLGIGSGNPLETQVESLFAYNQTSGDVEFTNTGGPLQINQLSNYGGNVVLDNAGDVTLESFIEASGNVTLTIDGALISRVSEGAPGVYADHFALDLVDGVLWEEAVIDRITGATSYLRYYAPMETGVNSMEIINRNTGSIGVNNNTGSRLDILGIRNNAVGGAETPLVEVISNADLYLAAPIVAPGSEVSLSVGLGGIIDNNTVGFDIDALSLYISADNGIGSGDPLETRVGQLAAMNTTSGSIEIYNTGALQVLSLANYSSGTSLTEHVILDNIGAITFADLPPQVIGPGPVPVAVVDSIGAGIFPEFRADNGDFIATAHSPLTVGTAGITAAGNIILTASATGFGDILTINSPLTSVNGMIDVTAGDAIIQAAGLTHSAPGGIFMTEFLNGQTQAAPQYSVLYAVQAGLDSVLDPAADPNADPDNNTSEGDSSDEAADTVYCN